ncbi:MAG: hypothetical protein ACKVQW_02035 [Pyrinomonadaceae bacterium]
MKLPRLKPSSCAAASLRIGIIIGLTIIVAALAYRTPAIIRLLNQNMLIALLTSLVFFVYVFCILVAACTGVVLSIVSLVRTENHRTIAVLGLFLNAIVLLLFAIKFFGWSSVF